MRTKGKISRELESDRKKEMEKERGKLTEKVRMWTKRCQLVTIFFLLALTALMSVSSASTPIKKTLWV